MNSREIEILEHFLSRTSMWIYPINEISVVSFIHGFEAGIDNKILTSSIKNYLESEYDIYGSNQGWNRQILLYANKRNIKWSKAFLEIGRIVLQDIIEASRE